MRAVRNAHFRAHVCLNLHSKHFWSHRYADSVGCFFLDMHGLIFYLSISPLAGSTRYLGPTEIVEANIEVSRASTPKLRPDIPHTKSCCFRNFHAKSYFFEKRPGFRVCTRNGRGFVYKKFLQKIFLLEFSRVHEKRPGFRVCTRNGRGFVYKKFLQKNFLLEFFRVHEKRPRICVCAMKRPGIRV